MPGPDQSTAPGPPWRLRGECLGALVRTHHNGAMPAGAHALPGPSVVGGARYVTSPVGPYLEMAVASPARLGRYPGFAVTTMAVDSAASRTGGRDNWGLPKELASMEWRGGDGGASVRWEERGIELQARAHGPAVPVMFPLCCLQERHGPVVVLGRLWGRLRLATVVVEVPAGDALEALAGEHRGFLVTGLGLVLGRARPLGP